MLFEPRQWLIPVFVLQLSTSDTLYQFGFNPWCNVAHYLPFEVERRRVKLGYSVYSIATRVIFGMLTLLWLWQQFG